MKFTKLLVPPAIATAVLVSVSCSQSPQPLDFHTYSDGIAKPNIILIIPDGLGYGELGCFGSSIMCTPNIDDLCERDVRLTDFHSNGVVSNPTHAALMTNFYQNRTGITGVVNAFHHRDGYGLDFLKETKDEPFFLYLPYQPPHYPIQSRTDKPVREFTDGTPESFREMAPPEDFDYAESYIAAVEHMDEGIGNIISLLRKQDRLDETVIVFMSDNGPSHQTEDWLNVDPTNGLRGVKNTVYEGGRRVPAFVFWPDKLEPGTSSETLLGMDFYPTFMAMAGASERMPEVDGIDMMPALQGKKLAAIERLAAGESVSATAHQVGFNSKSAFY